MTSKAARKRRNTPAPGQTGTHFEALEPRLLLSADLLGGALATDYLADKDPSEIDEPGVLAALLEALAPTHSSAGSSPALPELPPPVDLEALAGLGAPVPEEDADTTDDLDASQPSDLTESLFDAADSGELLFVDAGVTDLQQLLDDLDLTDETRDIDIVILDPKRDGVAQVTETLLEYTDLDAVHFVSHGADGRLQLGDTWLGSDNLDDYGAAVHSWQQALSVDADLLIYGCDLAGSEDGRLLIQNLGALTGADVAASNDRTGHSSLGGDWEFEYHAGEVESAAAFTGQAWQGVLAGFTVNTYDDTVDDNPGDGLAEDASGNTSLRAAIMEANALASADTITLGAGTYTLSLAGTGEDAAASGDLDITSILTIQGADAATTKIDAGGLDRVLEILSTGDADISGLTITNGDSTFGGGVRVQSGGALSLNNAIVNSNTAVSAGAGIYNDGTLILTDVEISDNTAVSANGGGLENNGNATLTGVTISGNNADTGAGIYNDSPNLSQTNVTISGNIADSVGGGIYTRDTIGLTNVTIAYNQASSGAGMHLQGGATRADLTNTILADNTGGNVSGTLSSATNSISTDATSGLMAATPLANLKLDTNLQDSGGPTKTHSLLSGSVAINAGTDVGAPAFDQRGYGRDTAPDIGAYEVSSAPPDGTFWLSTENDVPSSSGAPGLDSWQDGDVLQFGDPDLALEPDGTNGTFSLLFNMDSWASNSQVEYDAIHYVTANITVGSTNSVPLQPGDLLLSTVLNETLTSNNSISVFDGDVFVFRPNTPDNFTSGTFIPLLDESSVAGPNDWLDLGGFSLVEKDTIVGDTTLPAGSFIFVAGASTARQDIYIFTPSDVGQGTTDGTKDLLVKGSDIGLTAGIDGLDLIEHNVTVGDTTVAAGSILVSLDGDATTKHDISYLDISATTLVGGTSVATMTLLLDGSDLGLNTDAENINSLTLVPGSGPANPVNGAPAIGDATLAAVDEDTANPPGDTVSNLFGASFVDPDAGASLAGVAVIGNPENAAEGAWEYSTDGTNWFAIGTVSDGATARALSVATLVRFVPTADFNGTPGALTVRALDNTHAGGFSNTSGATDTRINVDTTVSGGPTPISGSASTLGTTINPVDDNPAFTATGPYGVLENSTEGTVVGDVDANDGDGVLAATKLVFTEIMYNPASTENDWEWVEIYNAGTAAVNLSGFVLDDNNGIAHGSANIATGTIAGGETAILYNADAVSSANFEAAWGLGLNITAVTNWTALPLNNNGDTISLWSSFADYSGDDLAHANALVTLSYDNLAPWALPDGAGSIYLTDFSADPNDGSNWALSTVGAVGPAGTTAYQSTAAGGNAGLDTGSPTSGNTGEGVTYSITVNVNPDADGNDAFAIDPVTGILTVSDADDLDFEANPSFVITVQADDSVNQVTTAVTINVGDTNDNPTGGGSLSTTSLNDNAGPVTLFSGITVNDVDAGESDLVLKITLSNAAAGAITGGGFTDQGGGVYTRTGLTVAQANTELDNVQFTPADNTGASGTFDTDISVDVDDQGGAGYQSVLSATAVTITRINDAPSLGNTTLTLTEGQTVPVTAAMLSATDVDDADPDLMFTVSGVSGGHFALAATPATPITSFTQAQVTGGLVVFVDDGDELAPSFDVEVGDGSASDGPVAATVNFTNQNDAPSLGNTTLTLTEGQTVPVTAAMLSATDVDDADPDLMFTVSGVSGGHFALAATPATPITSFTQAQVTGGLVVFVDDGDELAPSFDVEVGDGSASDGPVAATVNFTNQNDAPSLGNTTLTLNEGQTVPVTAAMLSATDVDDADPDLMFTVSGVSGGHFALAATPANPITSFTQAQVTGGLVVFVDDGDELAPSFDVEVGDGSASDGPVAATVNFTNQNDAPSLGNTTLTLNEGQTVPVTAAMLSATDVDDADPGLIFTVSSVSGGHFALAATPATPITSFTQAQVTGGLVVFVDDGDELAPSFDVEVGDGSASDGPVAATVNFTNQNDAPSLGSTSLTLNEGQTVTVTAAMLSATDVDDADPGLIFTVSSVTGGHFALAATPATPITSFTQAQVTGGLVVFVDDGDELAPSFDVEVGDGSASDGPVAATVNFTNQNDAPSLGSTSLTLNEGQTVTVTAAMLSATDVDDADPGLIFTVSSVTGGHFALAATPATPITSFTQAQVTGGLVVFVDDGDELAPSFDVEVGDGSASDGPVAATVNFTNQNDAPSLGSTSLTLNEGQTVTVTAAMLSATDVDDADPGLIFTVSSVTGGHFALAATPATPITSFTQAQVTGGLVVFVDDGDELAPSFDVEVGDGSASDGPVAATVNFTNQNDAPSLGNTTLTLNEGQTVPVTAAMLSATDVDDADPDLMFTVSGVSGGHFALAATPATPITSFTQAQVTGGLVVFVDDGDELAPSFDVEVGDGSASDGPVAGTVNITNQNDAPSLGNTTLTLNEGQTVPVTAAMLSATDVDDADPGLMFTVSSVSGGHFALAATPATPITSFTQLQVTGGLVVFVDDGDEVAPSFDVEVGDGSASDGPVAATVNFTNQNDAPSLGNTTLTLNEGQTVPVTAAMLSATDVDDADPDLMFTVSSVSGGHFALAATPATPITSFTQLQVTGGLVVFVDDGDEAAPSFDVEVGDGSASDGPVAATVNFTNQNDAPLGVPGITGTVTEDQVLNADTAAISDADGLGPFTYQWLRNGGAIGGATAGSYTLGDADVGALMSVQVRYTDGQGTVETLTSAQTAAVANVNDAPVLGNNRLAIADGGTVILLGTDLSATDVDHPDAALLFSVTNLSGGQFELVSNPGVAVTSFTQAQVTGGQVHFVHDDNGAAPAYEVSVSDGGLADGPLAAVISFTATGNNTEPPPPDVEPPPDVDPPPDTEPPPEPIDEDNGEPDAPPVDETETITTVEGVPGGSVTVVDEERLLPPVEIDGPPNPDADNDRGTASPGSQGALQTVMNAIATRPAALQALLGGLATAYGFSWGDLSALESDEYRQQLDRLRDDVAGDIFVDQTLVGSSIAVSTGLSVGYVLWLVRGGVLLSSVLSSLPAWRLIDPLPVLAYVKNRPGDDPDDGESLESLVEKQDPDDESEDDTDIERDEAR